MPREFHSFGAFAMHLLKRQAVTIAALHEGLEHVAKRIEETAKEEIGVYQAEVGPFPAWAPLAEATIEDRIRRGYSGDEPLLRTGELRDSISHEVEAFEAIIGSTSDVALYQELGTAKIPPRPFLGPAAIHNEKLILETLGAATVIGLTGSKALAPALGYEFKTTR